MATSSANICSICSRRIPSNALHLKCDCCNHFIHKNCSSLPKKDIVSIIQGSRAWSCLTCNETNFPFNNITENTEYLDSLPLDEIQHARNTLISDKLFSPFEIDDCLEGLDHEFNSDPDSNFFNEYCNDLSIESCYYLESEFNKYVSPVLSTNKELLSFIHLNIHSIKANGTDFYSYLQSLDVSFQCIALTETWLSNDSDNTYTFPGYKAINRTRKNGKGGGGVGILLKEGISCKTKENLCLMNDDIECVFVEACMSKKVLIAVIYRPPSRTIKYFNKQL